MKKTTWKKVVSTICIILFVVSVIPSQISGQTDTTTKAADHYSERFNLQFSQQDISFGTLNGYDTVNLQGCDLLNEVGKPQVPMKTIRIALPAGIQIENVRVESVHTKQLPGQYLLYPAQPAITTNTKEDAVVFVEPDTATYASTQLYPSQSIEFISQTDLAGQPIGEFLVSPVHYKADEKTLSIDTCLTFTVTGRSGYVCGDYLSYYSTETSRTIHENMIQSFVINPEDVQLSYTSEEQPLTPLVPPGGPYSHVIITTNSLSSYWAPLVEWNTKRGLKDTVVTTEYIYANYAGTSNQQKIRNFVIDAYNSWGTLFFLMAGEPTSVPLEYRTYYQESTPSDQYYSDFDDDWTHEVFVGRVTANSATEIDTYLDKVLFYEKTPPLSNYILDVLFIGMDIEPSTHMETMKEAVDGYIPAQFTMNKVYDSHGGSHITNALNYLNAGQHIVNHADHGYYDYMGVGDYWHGTGMHTYNIDALTNNNQLSVVVSMSCLSNAFDSSDSISEHWIIYNPMQAGVSYIGNTRLGYVYIGQPVGLSSQLDRDAWRGVFQQSKFNIGEAMIYAKHQFSTAYPDANVKQHCEWEYNLLGDPAMPVWTNTPVSLDLSHPTTLPIGPSSFTVHVTSGGSPVSSAYVCLWKGTEVYLTGNTNANGDITFNPSPATTGTMYVTVTKQNYLPKESSAQVQQQSTMLIDGYCFYPDMSPANTISVLLINTNTGAQWQASTNNNYYSKLLNPGDLNAGDTLRVIAQDDNESVNVTDHVVTSQEIGAGAIHLDLTLRVHYRDLIKFPFSVSMVNTGAMVMKLMLDYLMWNSTTHPAGPPSVYSEQTLYNTYKGADSVINGSELCGGLNAEVDDQHQTPPWKYGYFFAPYADLNANEMLKQICIWLDYPVDYYNDLRDRDVPLLGHPNHVPIAVPTGGNYNSWMVIRGIHTDRNAWLPPGQLTVYGFWLNDPTALGLGQNTYVTASRFLTTYFAPINVIGDYFNGKYLAFTDPYHGADQDVIDSTQVTIGTTTGVLSSHEAILTPLLVSSKAPTVFFSQATMKIVKAAYDQTMDVLKYDERSLAEEFSQAKVLSAPFFKNGCWTVVFGSDDATFPVILDRTAALLEFSVQ